MQHKTVFAWLPERASLAFGGSAGAKREGYGEYAVTNADLALELHR